MNSVITLATPHNTTTLQERLLIRKWLKILINRSLVLGTVDRPQLHDIVLDYVLAQHTPAVLSAAHRNVVELFRLRRPHTHGWAPSKVSTENQAGMYILHEVEYHIKGPPPNPRSLDALLAPLATNSSMNSIPAHSD
jgi:hypothetical protein